MNQTDQCCGTCLFFQNLNGASKVGPVPPEIGECRHSPPVMLTLTKPNIRTVMNPHTKRIENKTVIENEVKSLYPLVGMADQGCGQYDADYGKINDQNVHEEY